MKQAFWQATLTQQQNLIAALWRTNLKEETWKVKMKIQWWNPQLLQSINLQNVLGNEWSFLILHIRINQIQLHIHTLKDVLCWELFNAFIDGLCVYYMPLELFIYVSISWSISEVSHELQHTVLLNKMGAFDFIP